MEIFLFSAGSDDSGADFSGSIDRKMNAGIFDGEVFL